MSAEQTIVTREFRVPRQHLLLRAGRRHALYPMLACMAIALVLTGAGLIGDLRWIIVALMVIFIAMPMMLAYLFIWHMLKPAVVVNASPHFVEITTDMLHLTSRIELKDESEKASSNDQTPQNDNPNDSQKEPQYIERRYTFHILTVKADSFGLVFSLKEEKQGQILIPWDAFECKEHPSLILNRYSA